LGYRIVCEQVSHHPPISAFYADGPDFRFYGSLYPKLKFWGRSIECQPKGVFTLQLLRFVINFDLFNCNYLQTQRNLYMASNQL
jgi:hypothetical protein